MMENATFSLTGSHPQKSSHTALDDSCCACHVIPTERGELTPFSSSSWQTLMKAGMLCGRICSPSIRVEPTTGAAIRRTPTRRPSIAFVNVEIVKLRPASAMILPCWIRRLIVKYQSQDLSMRCQRENH